MSTAALHQDIQAHREELVHTVDALAAKLDVRPRLRRLAVPLAGLVAALIALKVWRSHRS